MPSVTTVITITGTSLWYFTSIWILHVYLKTYRWNFFNIYLRKGNSLTGSASPPGWYPYTVSYSPRGCPLVGYPVNTGCRLAGTVIPSSMRDTHGEPVIIHVLYPCHASVVHVIGVCGVPVVHSSLHVDGFVRVESIRSEFDCLANWFSPWRIPRQASATPLDRKTYTL